MVVRLDPAEGHEIRKTRPVVVVQNDTGNENASTTIVAPATGTHRGYPYEVPVEASDSPFETGPSIRLDRIRVVAMEQRIHSVLDRPGTATMAAVDDT